MITDEEFLALVDEKMSTYVGQIDHFYEAVGMIITGRLMGWKVMRLVSSRRCWTTATALFGDPKLLMPEEAKYTKRSIGYRAIKTASEYWDFVSGKSSRDDLPATERRLIKDS